MIDPPPEAPADPPLMEADDTLSPVDLPGAPEGRRPLLWTSVAIGVATLVLLVANAVTLDDWAKDLPPSAAAAQATAVTGRWLALTGRAGGARAWMHERWKAAEAARFQ